MDSSFSLTTFGRCHALVTSVSQRGRSDPLDWIIDKKSACFISTGLNSSLKKITIQRSWNLNEVMREIDKPTHLFTFWTREFGSAVELRFVWVRLFGGFKARNRNRDKASGETCHQAILAKKALWGINEGSSSQLII